MLYEIGKKLFKFFINAMHFTQIALVFLSFFTILYWLFQLGGATWITPFAPIFEGIKNTTHIFYQRTVSVDNVTIDFSFLIASFFFLLVVWGLKFVIEEVEGLEEKYDIFYVNLKKKTEAIFNAGLEQQYLLHESRINKFIILIKFKAKNLQKDSFYNHDVNVGVEEMQREILEDFARTIQTSLKCEQKFLNDGLLLYFDSFKEIDSVISSLDSLILVLKRKYHEQKWLTNALIGIDVYEHKEEILTKVKNLILLIRLGFEDELLCLGSFKQRYDLNKNSSPVIEGKGVYKINGNEDVFYLRRIK